MNKLFSSVLLFAGVCTALYSCSNGEYSANPSSNANGSINPLTPLTSSQFTWGGTDPMSANINGSYWVADTAGFALDSLFANELVGYNAGKGSSLAFYLSDVWGGNLYNMGYHKYNLYGVYVDFTDSTSGNVFSNKASVTSSPHNYYSYIGNSGEVKITENDSAYIKGLFYFQGVNSKGQIVNVTNGYFKIAKPLP
jgi:hypothetical protein